MARKVYKCVVSGKPIPKERVEALKMLGTPESRWTVVEHALESPRKGIYLGEVGTSDLLIVDKVYNDSVRSVFRGAKKEAQQAQEEDDSVEQPTYNEKELNYYNSNEEQVDPEEKIEIIKRHTD
jgi:RNA polymerase-binding transcription factor DksA